MRTSNNVSRARQTARVVTASNGSATSADYHYLGAALIAQADFTGGIYAMAKAASLKPNGHNLNNLGYVLNLIGDAPRARAVLLKAAAIAPHQGNSSPVAGSAYANLGYSYLSAEPRDCHKAVAAYRLACKADPDAPECWQGLCQSYSACKLPLLAHVFCKASEALQPTFDPVPKKIMMGLPPSAPIDQPGPAENGPEKFAPGGELLVGAKIFGDEVIASAAGLATVKSVYQKHGLAGFSLSVVQGSEHTLCKGLVLTGQQGITALYDPDMTYQLPAQLSPNGPLAGIFFETQGSLGAAKFTQGQISFENAADLLDKCLIQKDEHPNWKTLQAVSQKDPPTCKKIFQIEAAWRDAFMSEISTKHARPYRENLEAFFNYYTVVLSSKPGTPYYSDNVRKQLTNAAKAWANQSADRYGGVRAKDLTTLYNEPEQHLATCLKQAFSGRKCPYCPPCDKSFKIPGLGWGVTVSPDGNVNIEAGELLGFTADLNPMTDSASLKLWAGVGFGATGFKAEMKDYLKLGYSKMGTKVTVGAQYEVSFSNPFPGADPCDKNNQHTVAKGDAELVILTSPPTSTATP
jgi:tetratricopeptide (TPR) repeat protein